MTTRITGSVISPDAICDANNISTGSFTVPTGNTAQRTASPSDGSIRYNAETYAIETYMRGSWIVIGSNPVIPVNKFGFTNRIINGAMAIFQRGTAVTSNQTYSVDRWRFDKGNDATESVSQNTDAPAGFSYSLRNTISVADASIGSAQYSGLQQSIEGYNIADLGWGTANAQPVTLSFWVRSSVTGQYVAHIRNSNDSRILPANYTINSANTWEYKTITIIGDTSGTWNTTNGIGMQVNWYMALGSSSLGGTNGVWGTSPNFGCGSPVNALASNGNIFAITGVQLEKGTVATSFDNRDYGRELIMCQRYFQKSYDIETAVGTLTRTGYVNWNWGSMASYATVYIVLPVRMRAGPTVTNYNPDLTNTVGGRYWNGSAEVNFTGSLNGFSSYSVGFIFNMDGTSRSNMLFQWAASAEL